MRAVIHPGMHKTGTTSIQATLRKHAPEHVWFPRTAGGHNGMAMLLFENLVPPGLSQYVLDAPRVRERRTGWEADMRRNLGDPNHELVIFSAERLVKSDVEGLTRMRDFFAKYCDDVSVVMYLRPPVGYMVSSLQERLKQGAAPLEFRFPSYREPIERLDEVFGRHSVLLRRFDAASFRDNDVIADFLDIVDVDIPNDRFIRTNESVSLESFCLLYAQRHHGSGPISADRPGSGNQNVAFVDRLAKIGTSKLVFDRSLTDPVLAANRAELDWVEQRLGEPLDDPPGKADARTVANEADILAIADEHRAELEDLLFAEIDARGGTSRDPLLRTLDVLTWLDS